MLPNNGHVARISRRSSTTRDELPVARRPSLTRATIVIVVGVGARDDDAPAGVVDVDHRHAFGVDHLGDGPDLVGEKVDDVERTPAEGPDREHAAGRQPGGLRSSGHDAELSSSFQPPQDREHAAVVVVGGGQVELGEDVARRASRPPCRSRPAARAIAGLRAALGHQRQHLALARRQPLQRIAPARPGEQLRHDLGVERRAAVADPPHGAEELG